MQFILNAIHLHEGIACFVKNVYFYGINRGIMRKKSAQFLTILILMMGGVCFSGCDKDNEEDPLGASRPNYNMLSDLSKGVNGLYLTEWEWANTFGITMKLSFDRQECTYTYQESASSTKITAKYTYSFTYPTVILTPENAEESVITGTIVSGRITLADEATFVNAQKETVWKKLTRKK